MCTAPGSMSSALLGKHVLDLLHLPGGRCCRAKTGGHSRSGATLHTLPPRLRRQEQCTLVLITCLLKPHSRFAAKEIPRRAWRFISHALCSTARYQDHPVAFVHPVPLYAAQYKQLMQNTPDPPRKTWADKGWRYQQMLDEYLQEQPSCRADSTTESNLGREDFSFWFEDPPRAPDARHADEF